MSDHNHRLYPVPLVVVLLFACDLLMGVFAAGGTVLSRLLGFGRPWFFRLGQENNLPTWYSSSQLLLVGLLFATLGWHEWRRRRGVSWPIVVAAAVFTFLSLDEAASVHERVGHLVESLVGTTGGLRTGIWFAVWLPPGVIVLAALAMGLRRYLRGRRRIVGLYLAGVSAFLLSAVGFEALSNLWVENSAKVLASTFVEEIGEMCGVTLMLWATLLLVDAEGLRIVLEEPAA